MKLALFMPSLHGGGAERAMVTFAREALSRGVSVDLVVARAVGALQPLLPDGLRLLDLQATRMLAAAPGLARYLRRERPQALFSTITHANITAAVVGRASRAGARIILRQSNAPLSEEHDSWSKRVAHSLIPPAYRLADGIIAVSRGVADELGEMDPRLQPKVQVVPTPVLSPEILQQGQADPEHSWLAPGEPPVVLAAGRLMRHKGFDTLLEAFALVRRCRPARLLIIGEGSYRPELEKKVDSLGLRRHVDLPGFKRNPFAFMSRARCFVLSSEYEGLPNVLIQALGFGTPVVSTDCKSGPSEILERGRFGKLVPVGGVFEMAQAIHDSLEQPRQLEAQRSVLQRFGVAGASAQYLALAGFSA